MRTVLPYPALAAATFMLLCQACGLLPGSPSAAHVRPAEAPALSAASNQNASGRQTVIYLPALLEDDSLGLRAAPRGLPGTGEPLREALEALILGPNGSERAADFEVALDRRTRLLAASVERGTASIEFDEGIERVHGRPFSELVYWSIVYTATEVPGVERVRLLRQGSVIGELGDPPFTVPDTAGRDDAPAWARP